MRKSVCIFAVMIVLSWITSAVSAPDSPVIHEKFATLDNWRPLHFDKTKKDTVCSASDEGGITCLKAESGGSSSAIICNKEFDVYQYSVLRWRWKVSNVYTKGNVRKKEANDSPARLYVMFKYNPGEAGFFTRLKYSLVKKIYGQCPPRYALCYIWSNMRQKERIIASPVPALERLST